MQGIRCLLKVFCTLILFTSGVLRANAESLVELSLLPQYSQVSSQGESFLLGVKFNIKPGWHIYWQNPGDSGAPPVFRWFESEILSYSKPYWPPPKVKKVGPFVNIGYEREVILPIKVDFKGLNDNQESVLGRSSQLISLDGTVEYLACKEDCVPGSSEVHLDLAVGESSKVSEYEVELNRSLELSSHTVPLDLSGTLRGNQLVMSLPQNLEYKILSFLPYENGLIDLNHILVKQPSAKLFLKLISDSPNGKQNASSKEISQRSEIEVYHSLDLLNSSVAGDFVLDDGRAIPVNIHVIQDPTPTADVQDSGLDGDTTSDSTDRANLQVDSDGSLLVLCFYAFLGGIILNCMPCVFPIIGIKILQFTNHCKGDRKVVILHGLLFSLGIVVSMWVLSGSLIILRNIGAQSGWGFQLQYPPFVLSLIFLFAYLSANMLGLVTFGAGLQVTAARVDNGHGLMGSFSSGVLATFVATPCSAPFMGTAIGAALGLPAWQGLMIFTFLGLGVAFPFLLLCSFPTVASWMPRPGEWMEILKELLAFPLIATVIWLLYVLGLQTSLGQVVLTLTGLLICVLSFFLREKFQNLNLTPALKLIIFGGLLLLGIYLPFSHVNDVQQKDRQTISNDSRLTGWREYNRNEINELVEQGHPVFIDFTAAWCITCQLNKKTVLESQEIIDAFNNFGVTLFRADWTSSNDEITLALSELGRQSVPVNVLISNKKRYIFPTVLTKEHVFNKLSQLRQ
jgi:thiol:disulfide interchange protein DsbD